MRKEFRREDYILVVLAITLIFCFIISENLKVEVKDRWYDEKIKAALLMKKSMEAIKEEKIKLDLDIDKTYDVNETGLIGIEMSPITTTLGSLESKRTSTNPNFAAVVVDMLKTLKVQKGDCVAVNFSSSFPALNIAVLSAMEVLEVRPIIISSVGASTWGANIPSLIYGDMEEILYNKGILKNKSIAVSIGGADDIGKDMDGEIVSQIVERMNQYNRKIIYEPDYKKNIEERYELYFKDNDDIKIFINVGGNLVSMGLGENGTHIRSGINIRNDRVNNDASGLVQHFLNENIPVIHLLNIKKIAVDYGLPIDPSPLPKVGEGNVYFEEQYPSRFIGFLLCIVIFIILLYGNKVRSKYDW